MKTKQQLKRKTLALALALALAAGPITANATAIVDNVGGTQQYSADNSSGVPYDLFNFAGTSGSPAVLEFGSGGTYGQLYDGSIDLGGVNMSTAGTIQWDAGGQPTNRLGIYNQSGQTMSGAGTLTIDTVPFSGSTPENYLNLLIGGDQSLGAANLVFDGWGRVAFGSASAGIGDTQSLQTLATNADFSGVLDFYSANVKIQNVELAGNGFFVSKGGVNTVKLGAVYSPGNIDFGGLTPAGSSITFNMGAVQAKNISIGGSAPGGVTYNMPGGSINLGGSGTAVLDATAVNLGEVGVNGNMDMVGGNLTISPSAMGLQVSGDYAQSAGDLTLDITPSGQRGFIRTGGTYQITGGNVIVDGETGSYTNGQGYTLLESASTAGGNTYAPANTYYVYNGANSSTIDGLTAHLKQVTASNGQQQVDLCLGSTCVAQPQPIIPVHAVTPAQEAKPIVADSPSLTQTSVQNTAQTLVSTGVVGGGPRGAWLKTLGGFSSQDGYAGMNYGLLAGYGKSVGPDGRDVAGVAFSAGQAGLGTGPSDFVKASDYGLWLYGTYYPQASRSWKITGTIGGGLSTNTLMSTALGLPQTAHFGGGFMGTEIRASYWKTLPTLGGIIVSPRLSVGYNQSWTSGFTTHGGGPLDVQVSGQSDGQLYLEPAVLIGKKFNYHSTSGSHTIFPQLRVGVVENIGPNPAAEISSGQVAGQVQGLAYPHTQGMAEVRLDVISHTKFSKGLSANVSARQLFGGGASSTEFVAAIKYHW